MSMQINSSVISATKWSVITEIAAKLVAPVSTMVLARILTPEAFGILVTATMVISFAEIFTDAGFQKYLIQYTFDNDDKLYKSTAVAFWSNLIFSLIVWSIICIYSSQIAYIVGNEGYGQVIAVSCVCIPLAAFSSIQMALFKRKLDFKTLFLVRIVGIIIPLFITIPLALITRSYWSLIIGMITLNVSNAIILTWKSLWKPKWFYDIHLFKAMFAFTMWSMIESISIWLTGYLDIFIIGTVLDTYYMGVYRTAITTVGQIMGIITAATTPVLFSALSRLQKDDYEFKQLFFKFQKMVGLLVIPMGVGIFIFRNLITTVLLGEQWSEASFLMGYWGLTSAVTIVLSHYCSEVYRAKGKPKYSVIAQLLHMCFLVPTVLISVKYGFESLCLWRSLVRFTSIGINLYLLYKLVKISPYEMFNNIIHVCLASFVMYLFYLILPLTNSILIQCIWVVLCAIVYLITVSIFTQERNILINLKYNLRK